MAIKDFYKKINKKYDFSPSYYQLSCHLLLDSFIFVGIFFLLKQTNILYYIGSQILWAILFFRFFGLMHDSVHLCTSRNLKINNFIGYIAGAFCFLPYYPWKKMHLQHHYWAGNIEKDPVMKIIRDYNPDKKFKNKFLEFAWKSWIPVLALMQHTVFWFSGITALKETKTFKAKFNWILSYVIPGFIYFQLHKIDMFNMTNVGPGLLLYLVMVEVINFPHHLELPQNRGDKTLPFWEQYQVSRSCSYPKWISRLILNNFNYHSEHHMFPKAPWYMLDQLKEEISLVLNNQYNHSKNNEWILKNRKKNIESLLLYKSKKVIEENYNGKNKAA